MVKRSSIALGETWLWRVSLKQHNRHISALHCSPLSERILLINININQYSNQVNHHVKPRATAPYTRHKLQARSVTAHLSPCVKARQRLSCYSASACLSRSVFDKVMILKHILECM